MAEPIKKISKESGVRYAFGMYEVILRVMGIWPMTCQTIGAQCLTIFALITQITMVLFMLGETILAASQVDPQLMSFGSCNFLAFTKILVIRLNWRKMYSVIDDLMGVWNESHGAEALRIMRARAKLGRDVGFYQLCPTYIVLFPIIIGALPQFAPMVNGTMNSTSPVLRSFPLHTGRMFAGISTTLYVIMFSYQIIQLFMTCTGNVGNDVCFFSIALHLTAQLECLAVTCENLVEHRQNLSKSNIFAGVIDRHVRLIEYAEYLESTFNFIILCIVTANCSQICFYGILVIRTARAGDFVVCINTIICMIIHALQIFMYSYAGECMSRAIENVSTTAYKCLWYDMSPPNRQNVLFTLVRRNRIYSLTAGKVYRMDLDSFKNIMKALGSYFSVMQAMFNEHGSVSAQVRAQTTTEDFDYKIKCKYNFSELFNNREMIDSESIDCLSRNASVITNYIFPNSQSISSTKTQNVTSPSCHATINNASTAKQTFAIFRPRTLHLLKVAWGEPKHLLEVLLLVNFQKKGNLFETAMNSQFTIIWNENITYAFGLYRLITQSLGIWPFTCHNFAPKCQVLIVCGFQFTMMMSLLGEMHLNCGEVSDRIQMISLCSCAFMTIVKVVIIRFNNHQMHEIMMSAFRDWLSVKTLNEDPKMRSCAKLGRTICLFQIIAAYITTIPIIFSGFLVPTISNTTNSTDSDINILPLSTTCLFQKLPGDLYISVYIIQCIQLLITCTGNVGCDCYFFGVTMHLSGQIEKLADDLERLGKDDADIDCRDEFVSLVKRQRHLLNLADNLETTFNIIILVELMALTYQICLIALQMVVNIRMGNSLVIMNNIIMLQILYLQLFLYSYAGERLSSGLENLGSAIYSSAWCHLPTKITKDIIFVMMRCHKSFVLTAGKLCVMNLESFKNIIKAVGSYFSVLLAMFDK
ncbi:uncharacterized protein LOC135170645 [Diachasmimorpha longicaudata]|uniref:uncharacterized protein LOC135170645 n=1 Tax=Diachasmimorpha longicaudata TaxID=58733 RepID=UPI0030B8784D